MAKYYSLPTIYLGSSQEGESLYKQVQATYEVNSERFASSNLFLKHLLSYALENDVSLKRPAKTPVSER